MSKKVEPNYFYVNRCLLNSDRWLEEPFTRGQAWVDLFGLAQHTDGFFRVRGIKITVKRGQLGYSQVTLAKRWKWSRNKVRRYLKELEKDGDISLKTKHQNCDVTTVITITKYDKWQGCETPNETPEGHQKDTKRNTYKNDKNEKNNITPQANIAQGGKTVNQTYITKHIIGIRDYWNSYRTRDKIQGSFRNTTVNNGLLKECRTISPDIKESTRKILRAYTEEDIKTAIKNYIKEILNRNPQNDYAIHRFSLHEFLKQKNGFTKFINRG